jgi:hypothetical protein
MKKRYNVPELLSTVDAKFEEAAAKGKTYTKLSVTKDKIIAMRGWEDTVSLFEKNFDQVLTDYRITYVPRQIPPGALVLFPCRDVDDEWKFAQTKPLESSDLYHPDHKYHFIGQKPLGPPWLGSIPQDLQRILEHRTVIVVEGAFDFLACKFLLPLAPVLCPLTKRLSEKHIVYLRMLGVRDLIFMYDNEISQQGQIAAARESKQMSQLPDVRTRIMRIAGGGDPAQALQSYRTATQLRQQLNSFLLFPRSTNSYSDHACSVESHADTPST